MSYRKRIGRPAAWQRLTRPQSKNRKNALSTPKAEMVSSGLSSQTTGRMDKHADLSHRVEILYADVLVTKTPELGSGVDIEASRLQLINLRQQRLD